jgi:Cys-tRNA(Pro) deacylase
MPLVPPVSKALRKLGIPHRVFSHPGKLESLNQAAKERGQRPEQVVRSILFKISKGDYLMVLIAGGQQVDWTELSHHLGVSRIRLASTEEVVEITGYELGAVAPFGCPQQIRVLLDISVLAKREISIGSGVRGVAAILKSTDLVQALNEPEILEIGKMKLGKIRIVNEDI